MKKDIKMKKEIQKIIKEFKMLDDWIDKYNLIIKLGNSLSNFNEKYKIDSNVISGCQSKVWLHAEYKDGKVIFTADSDTIITKGIINILILALSEKTPDEIINEKLEFIDELEIKNHLSLSRSNGLNSMIKQMKLDALVFKTKYES